MRRIIAVAALALALAACGDTTYKFQPEDTPKDEAECGIVIKMDPQPLTTKKTPLGRYCTTTTMEEPK